MANLTSTAPVSLTTNQGSALTAPPPLKTQTGTTSSLTIT